MKESTYIKTEELLKNHILPSFGNYRIDKISISLCQTEVNDWFEKIQGYRKVKGYASKAFNFAIHMDLIEKNPLEKVVLPQRIKKADEEVNINYYNKEQLLKFLDHAKNNNNLKIYTFFRLLAFTGIRRSETLASTWDDMDFKNFTISISKSLARSENGRLIVNTPKTKKSSRLVSMDKKTIDSLKEGEKEQKSILAKLNNQHQSEKQLLFSSKSNSHLSLNHPGRWLNNLQQKYQLDKISVHGFRHTHCSLLFETGASIKEVQDRLGHSNVQTTMNIYAHVTEKAKERVMNKFEKFMSY